MNMLWFRHGLMSKASFHMLELIGTKRIFQKEWST